MAPAAALVCKAGAEEAAAVELSYRARAVLDDEPGACALRTLATRSPDALALLFLA